MKNKELFIFIFLIGIFISSVSQVLLKKSAVTNYKNRLREYLNPKVIIAYIMFILATICSISAYKVIPLSLGPVLECTGYLHISILSYVFLKEKICLKQLVGICIIILGVLIFSL